MSFRLSFHLALLGPSGAHWLDDPPDLSCQDSTQEYAVDGSRLSCKQQVGGSSPPASSQNGRLQAYTACLAWPDVIPMSFCSNWNDIRRLGGRTGGSEAGPGWRAAWASSQPRGRLPPSTTAACGLIALQCRVVLVRPVGSVGSRGSCRRAAHPAGPG